MYLFNTRLDISFVVNTLSQYMVEAQSVHWSTTKLVLRYIAITLDYRLDYVKGDGVGLVRYSDSDWVGSVSDWKSTLRCFFGLGSMVVSWFSRKKNFVALSSTETNYMAAS